MKKVFSCILIFAAIIALVQPVFAAQQPTIDPQYTNATAAYVALSISSSGTSTVTVTCRGNSNLKSASVTTYLEKRSQAPGFAWIFQWTVMPGSIPQQARRSAKATALN